MTTDNAALPPMAKISMIGIWIETVLYGVNCIMYGLCMFVLLRGGRVPTLRWTLVVTSTVLFILCTAHVGASLHQLLDAFIYAPADVPNYSTTYWLNFTTPSRLLKDVLYVTLVLTHQVVLIWRLYVVFMNDWRVIILPIILCIGCVGPAYAVSAVPTLVPSKTAWILAPPLVLSAWVFGLVLNVSVTLAIAARLWWMGRRMASLTATSTNRFASSVYIAIESGAISAVASAVVIAFSLNVAALAGFDVASQLIALTPFLIVVQLGSTGRGHVFGASGSKPIAQDTIVFRERIPLE